MDHGVPLELTAEIRRLLDVEAPTDPQAAAAELDRLIAEYGRGEVGAALTLVAPGELAELSQHPPLD